MEARAEQINKELIKIVENAIGHDQSTFNTELDELGQKFFESKWRGVHASDRMPFLKDGQYAILNLDKSDEPGSHWIAIARQGRKNLAYDSFGRKINKLLPHRIEKFFDADLDKEQRKKEMNCGQRSLAWLLLVDNWGSDMAMLV